MSQIAMIASPGTVDPDVETLTGDTGGAVGVDAAFNINILGGEGIIVTGNPATNTLTISDDDKVSGTVTTNNAVSTTCLTFPMGAVAGVYTIDGRITGFNTTDTAGAGYSFSGSYRTTGAAGIEIGTQDGFQFEEVAMAACDFDISAVGNNIIISVTGIALKTINWAAEFSYEFVGA
jgi:hypothetical protein